MRVTATQARNRFGAICAHAKTEPVFMEKDGRINTVIVSMQQFGALSPLREIDNWMRRRLLLLAKKQWGNAGYRELRKRGASVREAWNTSKSAHGPWRLSKTPALNLALLAKLYRQMGLPELAKARTA